MLLNKLAPIYLFALMLLVGACGTGTTEGERICTDTADRAGYPEGPYGKRVGDILENMTFKDSKDEDFSIQDLYQDGSTRAILISTGAGWCTACIEEQSQLEAWSRKYRDQGLKVVMTVFEDAQAGTADVDYAQKWKTDHDLTIPVLADGEAKFSGYYNAELAPMNMLIEGCTMKISEIIVGSKPTEIENEVVRLLK